MIFPKRKLKEVKIVTYIEQVLLQARMQNYFLIVYNNINVTDTDIDFRLGMSFPLNLAWLWHLQKNSKYMIVVGALCHIQSIVKARLRISAFLFKHLFSKPMVMLAWLAWHFNIMSHCVCVCNEHDKYR